MAVSTITIDARPTVFGDRMIITGSYTAGDTSTITIDLSSFLSEIDFAGANSSGDITAASITDTGAVPATQLVNFAPDVRIDGTSVKIAHGVAVPPTQQAGTFIAIGRRS